MMSDQRQHIVKEALANQVSIGMIWGVDSTWCHCL